MAHPAFGFQPLRPFSPSRDRAFDESLRPSEITEARGRSIDRVQRRHRRDHGLPELPGRVGRPVDDRCVVSLDDHARPVFEKLEGNANDGGIGAKVPAVWREWEYFREVREDTMLARHVVRTRRQVSVRRPAQDVRLAVNRKQVIDIGEPRCELPDFAVGIEI